LDSKSCNTIQVAHFYTKDSGIVQNFGQPFLILTKKEEPLKQIKKHIQNKLGITKEDLGKWKISTVAGGKVHSVKDSDTIGTQSLPHTSDYLGLEHPDNTKQAYRRQEKAIVIKG